MSSVEKEIAIQWMISGLMVCFALPGIAQTTLEDDEEEEEEE